MVLLKNRGDVLPLGRRNRSIAVIGPDADNTSAQGGGSATVSTPTRSVSPLDGITDRAGSAEVTYSPGTDGISEGDLLPGAAPVPSSVLTPVDGNGQGLSGE
ncbi:glycoside hydrolase family 3 protein [Aeromicrobium sp. UC242_57]|uniref:glycoside hydrolase family 3 protein n=1 Tax=Aeromicrobium sp. UC242_57 TaxID=3374624 RepID=UPI00379F3221